MKEEKKNSEAHRERVQEEFQEIEMIQIRPVINANEVFVVTRPKPAYNQQGLDWIVGPGYSFMVFSTNKLEKP